MRLAPGSSLAVDVRSESGLALVLVMGILLFFSLAAVAVTTMTTSAQSTASISASGQNAYAMAETGLNNALAVLENSPPNNPQDPNLLGSAASPNVTTTSTGSVSWYGVFDAATLVWTITSTSTVPNPVAGGAPLHTTLSRQVTLSESLNGYWNRIYQSDTSKCLVVPDQVDIQGNLTAQGDLCLDGGIVTGADTVVTVGGTTTLTPVTYGGTKAVQPAGSGSGWTNSGNIGAQDNVAATATIPASSDGPVLRASNFGFTIPPASAVTGVSVKLVRWASASSAGCCVEATHVYLLQNGVASGIDHANNHYWPNKSGPDTFGANNDTWGLALTGSDVDSPGFGVQFSTHNFGTSSVTGYVDYVEVTVSYTPMDDASIGVSGGPVKEADLGGTCNYNGLGGHTPCGAVDHVWAAGVTTNPQNLSKPAVDFPYWYTNAAPGPMHGCDVSSGTPLTFDTNAPNYDGSVGGQKIAGVNVASYTCVAKDSSGNVIGQLSWNQATQVLTISGVIFVDGEADFGSGPGTSVIHYQGRGAIYASGGSHIDVPVCAGGYGPTNCATTGMSNWDPNQNLLVLVVGDKQPPGHNDCKIDEESSVFQGVYWVKNTCDMAAGARISGPIIATDLAISNGHVSGSNPATLFYPWPPLGSVLPGVLSGTAAYTFTLGPEMSGPSS
jgi:hypothetical protein